MGGKFVDYSIPRGDREEEDEEIENKYEKENYALEKETLKEENKPKLNEKPKFKVPRAFDEKYYAEHVRKAREEHDFDRKYILYWEQLERYAKSAFNFYTHVMCEFYKNLNMQEQMPNFVSACLNEE